MLTSTAPGPSAYAPGRMAVPKVRAFIDFAVHVLRSGFARIAADAANRLR